MMFVARSVWTFELNFTSDSACIVLFIYICIEQWQVESRVKLSSQVYFDRATSSKEDYAICGYIYIYIIYIYIYIYIYIWEIPIEEASWSKKK